MPKERFFHLPEEKQKRICRAVYEELSEVPYEELSINRIVQRARIPRGSFYQYFEDKEDMLCYMMEGFREHVMGCIRKFMEESRGDVFYVYEEVLKQMAAFGEREEHYRILQHIFSGLHVGEIKSFEVFRAINEDFVREVYPLADLSRFRSGGAEDFMELIELLGILIRNAAAEMFEDITQKEVILQKVARRLEMIKYGVFKKEDEKSNVEV